MTSTIRVHLKHSHEKAYQDSVIRYQLKYAQQYAQDCNTVAGRAVIPPRYEPFSLDGFLKRLEDLIVENDLVRIVFHVFFSGLTSD